MAKKPFEKARLIKQEMADMEKKETAKQTPVSLDEDDFIEGRYRLTWEGADPLADGVHDLKELQNLIEDWAVGKIPDKTIALKAPRILIQVIDIMDGVDDELAKGK